jgi:predicted methyltransferase
VTSGVYDGGIRRRERGGFPDDAKTRVEVAMMMRQRRCAIGLKCLAALALAASLAGCAAMEGALEGAMDGLSPVVQWLVRPDERSQADRALDERRKPAQLLQFYDVRRGMRVLDMGAGAGYNTELLSRAVGPTGTVYAQNTQDILDRVVKGRFDERRRKTPVMRNVIHFVNEFEAPVPSDIRRLDLVAFNFVYHDTVWLGVDRAKMNRAVFEALKPGGVYIVADHSARAGVRGSVAKSLHRIDEALVREEVEAAGFKLVAEADFLRNTADWRDTLIFKSEVPTDRFILKFVKP